MCLNNKIENMFKKTCLGRIGFTLDSWIIKIIEKKYLSQGGFDPLNLCIAVRRSTNCASKRGIKILENHTTFILTNQYITYSIHKNERNSNWKQNFLKSFCQNVPWGYLVLWEATLGCGDEIFLLCAAVCLQITFMDLASCPLKIQKCNAHPDVRHNLPVIPDYWQFFLSQLFVDLQSQM